MELFLAVYLEALFQGWSKGEVGPINRTRFAAWIAGAAASLDEIRQMFIRIEQRRILAAAP